MIFVIVQSIAGILRPHTPEKGEQPNQLRILWEYGHKLCGVALLGMGWYQCHSGLIWYASRFVQEEDYTRVFWGITGTIAAIGISGKIHGLMTIEAEPIEEKKESETPAETSTQDEEIAQPAMEVVDLHDDDDDLQEVDV